jgi:hypothetical protein
VPPAPDTTPADLSHLHAAIPPSAAETGGPAIAQPHKQLVAPSVGYPAAPDPVRQAVTREQAVSQFCFQEFGQKTDPTLEGAVAVVVTVASGTISGAHVAGANWTDDRLGAQVDRCLNDRISQAWRLASDDSARVAAGRYVVYLGFRRN